ncbi:MAG: Holliday junction resolvase RuvX [Planctomycetales bacterium]|nr:Holliday junction resolvase RuvX [Planctomycetales bacterium]
MSEPNKSPQLNSSIPAQGRVAGIDYGTVRIGIAVSDAGRSIASPYENVTRSGVDADARRFRRLVDEEQITLFVVGLPVHLSGEESQKSHEARQFGEWLREQTGVPVVYFDERFSSAQAEAYLLDAQLTKRRRKKRLDMVAAQIMLTAYLESSRHHGAAGIPDPRGLDER